MHRAKWYSLFGLLVAPGSLFAASMLKVQGLQLEPNQPGQMLVFYLENQSASALAIGGFDLAIQIGDGNPDLGPKPEKPQIASVDLLRGTAFAGFTPQLFVDPGNQTYRQFWSLTIPALGGFPEIPAYSQVAVGFVELDTTDLLSGTYALSLSGTLAGDTVILDSFGLPLLENEITNFELKIESSNKPVPDSGPGVIMLMTLLPILFFAPRRRES